MIKAVIFDFDGVLAESANIKVDAFGDLFKDYPQHVAAIRRYQIEQGGISRVEKIKYFYQNIIREPLSSQKLDEMCRRFQDIVLTKVIQAPWIAGAKELLEELHGRVKIYVASGTPQDEMREIIEKRKMSKFFDGVFGSPAKKAEIVKEILTMCPCRGPEAVFIGDSINDLEAAKTHGLPFIARVESSMPTDWTKDPLVYARVSDLTSVGQMIKNLNKNSHAAKK